MPQNRSRDLTAKINAIAVEFKRLIAKANKAGVAVVVDSDAQAIRLMSLEVAQGAGDLRNEGQPIRVDNACGSPGGKVGGSSCNYGNL